MLNKQEATDVTRGNLMVQHSSWSCVIMFQQCLVNISIIYLFANIIMIANFISGNSKHKRDILGLCCSDNYEILKWAYINQYQQ